MNYSHLPYIVLLLIRQRDIVMPSHFSPDLIMMRKLNVYLPVKMQFTQLNFHLPQQGIIFFKDYPARWNISDI